MLPCRAGGAGSGGGSAGGARGHGVLSGTRPGVSRLVPPGCADNYSVGSRCCCFALVSCERVAGLPAGPAGRGCGQPPPPPFPKQCPAAGSFSSGPVSRGTARSWHCLWLAKVTPCWCPLTSITPQPQAPPCQVLLPGIFPAKAPVLTAHPHRCQRLGSSFARGTQSALSHLVLGHQRGDEQRDRAACLLWTAAVGCVRGYGL